MFNEPVKFSLPLTFNEPVTVSFPIIFVEPEIAVLPVTTNPPLICVFTFITNPLLGEIFAIAEPDFIWFISPIELALILTNPLPSPLKNDADTLPLTFIEPLTCSLPLIKIPA